MEASMTLLRDGHVLVAGGWCTRTKERRGCSMGTPEGWRPTGQLNGDREAHGAVALRDGRVMVVAGQGPEGRARGNPDDELDSVEIWDPRSERWTVAAPLRLARVNPTALLLTDGRVMVLAGRNSIDPDSHIVEVFDPRENRWSQTAPLVYPREMGTGVVLRDGRVFVAGCGGQGEGECRAEVWDPHTGEWSCVEGAMSEPRYWHTMTALPDGGVLIAGGTWDTDESSRFAQVWRP
jgi:hypothetical protein